MAVGAAMAVLAPAADAATTTSACPGVTNGTSTATLKAAAPPKLHRDKILTVEDRAAAVDVLANDESSDGPLTLLAVTTPGHGTVTWSPSGSVTYRPADGYVGFDQFGYSAGDAAGRTSTNGIVGVRVCNVPATADAVSLVGTFNKPVGFNPLDHAHAPPGDTVRLWSYSQPAHGQVGMVGDQLTYLPDTGFSGTDHFTYTVTDGQDVCSTAPVDVRIPVATEVSPIPPIKRAPPPIAPAETLPVTGPADVGWLALVGFLLVGLGALLVAASRSRHEAVAHAGFGEQLPWPRRVRLELAAQLSHVHTQVARLAGVRRQVGGRYCGAAPPQASAFRKNRT